MKKFVFIGSGGFIGACFRYFIKGLVIFKYNGTFPINTMLINISGSFILAFILTTAFEIIEIDEDIRLGLTAGFLGAFTTFSTMCKETAVMMEKEAYFPAFVYITASVFLGLLFAYSGVILSRQIMPKFKRQDSK